MGLFGFGFEFGIFFFFFEGDREQGGEALSKYLNLATAAPEEKEMARPTKHLLVSVAKLILTHLYVSFTRHDKEPVQNGVSKSEAVPVVSFRLCFCFWSVCSFV